MYSLPAKAALKLAWFRLRCRATSFCRFLIRSSSSCSELLGLFKPNGGRGRERDSASTARDGSSDRHQSKTHSAFSAVTAPAAAVVVVVVALAALVAARA